MLTVIKEELKIKPDSKTEIDVKDPSLSAQVVDHQEGKRFSSELDCAGSVIEFFMVITDTTLVYLTAKPSFINGSNCRLVLHLFHLLSMDAKVDYSLPNTVNNII